MDDIFVGANIAERIRGVAVDAVTDASDHQPVLLKMADWNKPVE